MSIPHFQLELLALLKQLKLAEEPFCMAQMRYISVAHRLARAPVPTTPVADIAALTKYAHRFGSRIFVTLNTILHDTELEAARQLITQLYEAEVDALIVQDMGILELDIPPIE